MKLMIRSCAMLFAMALLIPAACAQTLTGVRAQKSPQANAFLAYEKALIAGGLDAARPYMTAEKIDDLQGMARTFGDAGFQEFLDRMRSGAQGEARRRQIEKVEVNGDTAVLEARDDPHSVTVQYLARTRDGWKVSVRR